MTLKAMNTINPMAALQAKVEVEVEVEVKAKLKLQG